MMFGGNQWIFISPMLLLTTVSAREVAVVPVTITMYAEASAKKTILGHSTNLLADLLICIRVFRCSDYWLTSNEYLKATTNWHCSAAKL